MSEVKWIKLNTHMFEDEKIKLIEQMPDADTILIIWVKLLSQAGKTNASGYIYLSEKIPYTDEMLATIFGRPVGTVRLALQTFRQFGMIDIDENDFISISNWEKHQNVEGLERIREQNRKRVQKHREQKKLQSEDNVTLPETLRNAPEEELDKEEEKEHIPYKKIIDHLNEKTGQNFKHKTKKTQELIKARWNEGNRFEDFQSVVDHFSAEWSGQTFSNGKSGDAYLRPSTLFNGKFDERLNEAKSVRQKNTPKPSGKTRAQIEHEQMLKENGLA